VPLLEPGNGVVQNEPEQDALIDDVLLRCREPLDLTRERLEPVLHQQGLGEEMIERMPQVEPLHAGRERGGVTDEHRHIHVEP